MSYRNMCISEHYFHKYDRDNSRQVCFTALTKVKLTENMSDKPCCMRSEMAECTSIGIKRSAMSPTDSDTNQCNT